MRASVVSDALHGWVGVRELVLLHHGMCQLLRAERLAQQSVHARLNTRALLLLRVRGRQCKDASGVPGGPQELGRLDPATPRKGQIHQDDVEARVGRIECRGFRTDGRGAGGQGGSGATIGVMCVRRR